MDGELAARNRFLYSSFLNLAFYSKYADKHFILGKADTNIILSIYNY